MAARLPVVGGDTGDWGAILNQFLQVSHKTDGSLNASVVGSEQLATDAVAVNLGIPGASHGQILMVSSTSPNGMAWVSPSSTGSAFASNVTGVCMEQGGVYPTRPTGFANVKFIGTNDPGTLALDGDEWIKL